MATTTDQDLSDYARSDGYDILFTAGDGVTKLNYEREYYDNSSGELAAWIQTDVSSSSDTVLFMYYGNAGMATDLLDEYLDRQIAEKDLLSLFAFYVLAQGHYLWPNQFDLDNSFSLPFEVYNCALLLSITIVGTC